MRNGLPVRQSDNGQADCACIHCRAERDMRNAIPAACDCCGCVPETLHEVEDRDANVGYRAALMVCAECLNKGEK